ncbi:MAG: hypothetical protein JWQ35_2 [Bacteriovoracaceae bacterium]|nr:hypothetical protein [Bacteriovoracaceae bacterium]
MAPENACVLLVERERTKRFSEGSWPESRIRSPSKLPPETIEDGSQASQATRLFFTNDDNFEINEDFPTPAGPVKQIEFRNDFGEKEFLRIDLTDGSRASIFERTSEVSLRSKLLRAIGLLRVRFFFS